MKKQPQSIYVYSAVPPKAKPLIRKYGLLSGIATIGNLEVLRAARPSSKERREFVERTKKVANSERPYSVMGPSVLFTPPDPSKITKRHFIKQWDLQTIRIDLKKLVNDYPETMIWGVELLPYDKAWRDMTDAQFQEVMDKLGYASWKEFAAERSRELTLSEVFDFTQQDPKNLWKHYDLRDAGKYYAANVPHAFIITPMGYIPYEYIEYVDEARKNPSEEDSKVSEDIETIIDYYQTCSKTYGFKGFGGECVAAAKIVFEELMDYGNLNFPNHVEIVAIWNTFSLEVLKKPRGHVCLRYFIGEDREDPEAYVYIDSDLQKKEYINVESWGHIQWDDMDDPRVESCEDKEEFGTITLSFATLDDFKTSPSYRMFFGSADEAIENPKAMPLPHDLLWYIASTVSESIMQYVAEGSLQAKETFTIDLTGERYADGSLIEDRPTLLIVVHLVTFKNIEALELEMGFGIRPQFGEFLIRDTAALSVGTLEDSNEPVYILHMFLNGETNMRRAQIRERDVYHLLIHEWTHLRDRPFRRHRDWFDMDVYRNMSHEVVAYLQQIIHDVNTHRQVYLDSYKRKANGIVEFLNKYSPEWQEIEKSLSPKNRKRILSAVYTALYETRSNPLEDYTLFYEWELEDHDEFEDMYGIDPYSVDPYKIARDVRIGITRNKEFYAGHLHNGSLVSALFIDPQDCFSFDIVVDPMHQAKGLGDKLVDEAIDRFDDVERFWDWDDENAPESYEYCVEVVNPHMKRLLERKGFYVHETSTNGESWFMRRAR